jgi:tryptophanyl-tRNA synthetase
VPEHAELFLLLSMVTPVTWLERVPTYKEQQEDLKDRDLSTLGFLSYPCCRPPTSRSTTRSSSRSAPDQVAHLELSREAVRRFNNVFGDVLVEPQPLLTPVSRCPGSTATRR